MSYHKNKIKQFYEDAPNDEHYQFYRNDAQYTRGRGQRYTQKPKQQQYYQKPRNRQQTRSKSKQNRQKSVGYVQTESPIKNVKHVNDMPEEAKRNENPKDYGIEQTGMEFMQQDMKQFDNTSGFYLPQIKFTTTLGNEYCQVACELLSNDLHDDNEQGRIKSGLLSQHYQAQAVQIGSTLRDPEQISGYKKWQKIDPYVTNKSAALIQQIGEMDLEDGRLRIKYPNAVFTQLLIHGVAQLFKDQGGRMITKTMNDLGLEPPHADNTAQFERFLPEVANHDKTFAVFRGDQYGLSRLQTRRAAAELALTSTFKEDAWRHVVKLDQNKLFSDLQLYHTNNEPTPPPFSQVAFNAIDVLDGNGPFRRFIRMFRDLKNGQDLTEQEYNTILMYYYPERPDTAGQAVTQLTNNYTYVHCSDHIITARICVQVLSAFNVKFVNTMIQNYMGRFKLEKFQTSATGQLSGTVVRQNDSYYTSYVMSKKDIKLGALYSMSHGLNKYSHLVGTDSNQLWDKLRKTISGTLGLQAMQ